MNKPLPQIARTLINLELVQEQDVLNIASQAPTTKDLIRQIHTSELISSTNMGHELSSRFGAPLMDVSCFDLESLKHLALPIYKHGKKLYVAVIDPTNKAASDEIKFYTGLDIFPVQTELHLLEGLIDRINNNQGSALDELMDDDEFDLDLPDGDDSEQNFNRCDQSRCVRYSYRTL